MITRFHTTHRLTDGLTDFSPAPCRYESVDEGASVNHQ